MGAEPDGIVEPLDITRNKFKHARFVAAQIGFKQSKNGDIEIVLQVPFSHRALALDMLDASGMPLSVDVVRWRKDVSHGG